MIHRRELPGVVRLGRRVLVRRETVLTWLRSLEEHAPNARTEEPACRSRPRGPAGALVRIGSKGVLEQVAVSEAMAGRTVRVTLMDDDEKAGSVFVGRWSFDMAS